MGLTRRTGLAAVLSLLGGAVWSAPRDRLNLQAMPTQRMAQSPITSLIQLAGGRIVAAGWRGLIGVSSDGGQSWQQASVPVSVDITSLAVSSGQHVWATGADGVLLESVDGGLSWKKRFDGNSAARWMLDRYQSMAAAIPGDASIQAALAESNAYVKEGPGRALLSVGFEDGKVGYAVGAFGIAFRSTDGGETWVPFIDRIENPNGYHLYDVAVHRGEVFVCGELGTLLKLDRSQDRFVKVPLPYEGSLFTMVSASETLVAAGLRGNAFVSSDGGGSWARCAFGSATPGSFSSGTVLGEKQLALATQSGQVFLSNDGGRRFVGVGVKSPMQYSALIGRGAGNILTAGARGVRFESLS